jgi:hypothetical protein
MMANSSSNQVANKDNDNETPSPPHQVYLNGDQIFTCSGCHTHLAKNDDIISKVYYLSHPLTDLQTNSKKKKRLILYHL